MAQPLRVGGDIDSFCTRCKMVLGHTILAMVGKRPVRVRCNTCGGEHNYRGSSAPARKGSWVPASERASRPAVTSWERFEAEDVLEHPVFGIGLVQEVRGDKISVAFKADVKTLVHGKG